MLRYTKALSLALLFSLPALASQKETGKLPAVPVPVVAPAAKQDAKVEAAKKEVVFWDKSLVTRLSRSDIVNVRYLDELLEGEGTKEKPYKSVFYKETTTLKDKDGKVVELVVEPVIVEKETSRYLGFSSTKSLEVKKQARDPQYAQELKELTWERTGRRTNVLPEMSDIRSYEVTLDTSTWKAIEGKEKSKPLTKNEVAALVAATLGTFVKTEQAKLDELRKKESEQAAKTQTYINEIERRKKVLGFALEIRGKYNADEQIRLAENDAAKVREKEKLTHAKTQLDQVLKVQEAKK